MSLLTVLLAAQATALAPPSPMREAAARFQICTAEAVKRFSRQASEPAQTVVDAALGQCASEHTAVRGAVIASTQSLSSTEVDLFMKSFDDEWQPQLLALVFRARSQGKP